MFLARGALRPGPPSFLIPSAFPGTPAAPRSTAASFLGVSLLQIPWRCPCAPGIRAQIAAAHCAPHSGEPPPKHALERGQPPSVLLFQRPRFPHSAVAEDSCTTRHKESDC